MSDKKIDDSVSDDEDDELFSYLKTAHTVKHVKVEPIKAYEIGKSARKKRSSESVNKSDVLDNDKVSNQRRTLRKTRQPVKSKSNVKDRNRQVILLSHDGIDETLNHEKDDSNNFGSYIDLTSNVSVGNHKETSVNEVDLLCGENTNYSYKERLTLSVDGEKKYPHQLNETGRDVTQDFQHDVDSDAVVNNTSFTYSIDDAEHNYRDNGMLGNNTEIDSCSSKTEYLSQENKYYLINERDWIKLFPSIPTNKPENPLQEFHLPVSNQESPFKIRDYGRNKTLASKMSGNNSSSAKCNTAVRPLAAVSTEAAVTMKQAPDAGTQNVEVVYVRLEDGKLKCDEKNSPVKNAIVRSPRKYNNSEDIRTKRSDTRNSGNDDTSVGEEDNIHEVSEESGNLEQGFQGRFVRINKKLTRVLHKNDQTHLEPVLSQDVELVEEKPGEEDNHSEEDGETAFFFDLNDWNETQTGTESDLKIYPISIQDDSYAFVQASGCVERYLAHPVHLDEEDDVRETAAKLTCELSESANSHTLHTYQRFSSIQDGKHSGVDHKIVSGKSPVKMITFSPCKILKSPEKKTPLNKAEVISSSAQIIKNLWRNFKPDNFKQKLPGSVNSEDIIKASVKLGIPHTKEDAECTDSDSDDDNENDTLFSYLRQRKRKNIPKCNVSNRKKDEDQSSLHKIRSDKAVHDNSRSMCVQTNINDFDIELQPNRVIGKCFKNKVKKTKKNMLLSTSGSHQCKVEKDNALNKCKIGISNEKKRKELDSNGEIDYLTENDLKKTCTDNIISRNCGKNVEKKSYSDASQGKAGKENPNSRKRKARSGNTTSEIIAKKTKVSGPEMSLSKKKERKMQSSGTRTRKLKALKSTSQTRGNVTKMTSVSNQCSRKLLNVVNDSKLELSDEVKYKNDGKGDEIPVCTVCDCNRLDVRGRTRSTNKFLESDTNTKTQCKICECKPSRPQKKKSKKCKEKSGKDNNEKEKGKRENKECADASDKSKRKGSNKRSACRNVKNSNFEKKISKGWKISDNRRKDKTNSCNIKGDNIVRKKFKGKKGGKRKQDDVIRRMEEVLLDSAEADDIRKWGNIENSKVDFLERLFHIKLKEATGPDAVKTVSDSISSTEYIAGNGGFNNSGKPEATTDMDVTDVQIKESERKLLGNTDDSKDYVKIHDQSDLNTNINAANAITNVETDEETITLRQSTEVVEKVCDKDNSTKVKSNILGNDIHTGCVDTNISVSGSKMDSRTRMKHLNSKKKDTCNRRDKVKPNAGNRVSDRRHKNVRSLKQLHSKSKAGFKRKAENWKEHLQDKAFKFDFDKDLNKTYTPLNVKAMIRKILKPLGGSDTRTRGRERDKKKFRKQKAVRIKQNMRNKSRLRVTSESDDMWMSDSGPGGTYPAFKFSISEHGMKTPLHSSGGKTLNS